MWFFKGNLHSSFIYISHVVLSYYFPYYSYIIHIIHISKYTVFTNIFLHTHIYNITFWDHVKTTRARAHTHFWPELNSLHIIYRRIVWFWFLPPPSDAQEKVTLGSAWGNMSGSRNLSQNWGDTKQAPSLLPGHTCTFWRRICCIRCKVEQAMWQRKIKCQILCISKPQSPILLPGWKKLSLWDKCWVVQQV